MIGVVGLGAYAVYRLTRTKPDQTPIFQPGANPGQLPSGIRNIIGPDRRAVVARGAPYRGRIELGAASIAQVGAELQRLGFSDVRIYNLQDIQADPSLISFNALDNALPTTRWFYARWNGSGTEPRVTITLPAEATLLWLSSGEPPLRTLTAGWPTAGWPVARWQRSVG